MMRIVPVATGVDLTLPNQAFSLELANPYFESDAIPGITSLPADFPWTRENLQGLGFPHLHRGPGRPEAVEVDYYLEGVRWRRGRLVYRECDVKKERLRYNFVADAADLQTQIKDVRLPTLALGTVPLQRVPCTADYALLPVRNRTFFGTDADEAPAAYHGVLNYYAAGQYPPGALLAPQPYLVPLLRKVMGHFGFTVVGPWVEEAEVQQLVLYSDRVLAAGATEVDLARHVPDLTVPALLLGLRQMFCLGLRFDVARKELHIRALRDVLAGAGQYRDRVGDWQGSVANDTNGFALQLAPGDDDELDKSLDTAWQQLRVGAGGEGIEIGAGTLHQVREADGQAPGRSWLLPAIEAKGASPEHAIGDESRTGLRLLFDRGLQADSQGNAYPLGTAGHQAYDFSPVGQYALQLHGPAGLYAQWYQAWLDFRSRAVTHTYEAAFRIADLLTLDPGQAELVDYHLNLWQQVSLEVDAGHRLTHATITYQEIL